MSNISKLKIQLILLENARKELNFTEKDKKDIQKMENHFKIFFVIVITFITISLYYSFVEYKNIQKCKKEIELLK